MAWLAAAAIALAPRAFAQTLPDLGGGDFAISPQLERRIGESIVREIRFRDPTYIDDPEAEDYLKDLGTHLAQANPALRTELEFFVLRDHTVNAFALPGGFVGVHTGLINTAETESELAAVLAHELGHVSQRHLARMLTQQQQMQMPMMVALASGRITMQSATLKVIAAGRAKKGDVLGVARLAAIQAAKRTADLIPLAHPLALSRVAVDFELERRPPAVRIDVRVECRGPTGVEMEALTGAAVGLLTVYDMVKAVDRGMTLEAVRLEEKSGGRSGVFRRSRS